MLSAISVGGGGKGLITILAKTSNNVQSFVNDDNFELLSKSIICLTVHVSSCDK